MFWDTQSSNLARVVEEAIFKWIIRKETSSEVLEQRDWTASVAEQIAHILTTR